ncbi:MAG: aminopeptidase P family protein [Dehalococcoidales bacterium]|nr:aminopeptidase P family protein [Dehalococcoidales bacterium]
MNNRLQHLRESLARHEIDGIFISQPENRYYLSGFHGTAGFLFITETKAVLATDFRYTEQAITQAPDFEILRIAINVSEWFPGLVRDAGVKRLGFESPEVSYQFYNALSDALQKKDGQTEMVPVCGIVEKLRIVKQADEIEKTEQAVAISDRALTEVEKIITAGMTENQVAWELEKRLRENGSQSLPFEIIVASGPKAALPHHLPSDRVISEGEPIVIDMGARCQGYASDLTRTLCIGEPGDQFKKVYGTVLDAQLAALAIIKGGITGGEADAAARSVIQKAGYGEDFGHGLGHGVGLAVHEAPRLSPGSEDILNDGMIFSVEPGIYLSGWGGVRIEDTVVIENGTMRVLSQARKASYD